MSDALLQLALFTAKSFIIVFLIFTVLILFFVILAKAKQKSKGQLHIKNLNHKFADNTEMILSETLPKKDFKKFLKDEKNAEKKKEETSDTKNIYVLNFHGDIRASAVASLTEEINAVLNVAKPKDEIVIRLESGGGTVHGYGLGAAQLMRIRSHNIPLTVAIDKVAASGGYLMACTANKIIAAPFAIIGSIGVVIQMPNFNRLLKEKQIDFEMQTAGDYKRTLTMFGENTDEGREKLQEEIEKIHDQFKNLITQHRPQINIAEVATGEHWLAQQAISLQLVDEIKTSDEYLLNLSHSTHIYEIFFEERKPLLARLTASTKLLFPSWLGTA